MFEIITSLGLSLWLGILTSISPCPMATNIAAISFVSKDTTKKNLLLNGLLYTLGRAVIYIIISMLLVLSFISAPKISMWLQNYMNKVLGPILVVTGMVLLEFFDLSFLDFGTKGFNLQNKIKRFGIFSTFLIGALFALSFCPISAALFFGSLVPISISHKSYFLMPLLYGIGTALPVVLFSILLVSGSQRLQSVFNKITKIELYFRQITGYVFIAIGIYLILVYIFEINIF